MDTSATKGFLKLKYETLSNGEAYAYRDNEATDYLQTLVLIHGNPVSSRFFDTLVPTLGSKLRIIAPDLRGMGHSTHNTPFNSHKDLANDLKLLFDKIGLTNFSILGWSAGGATTMAFAALYPKYINKIILLASLGPQGRAIRKHISFIPTELYVTKKEDLKNEVASVMPLQNALNEKNKAFMKQCFDNGVFMINKPSEAQYDIYLEEILLTKSYIDMTYANIMFNMSNKSNGACEGEKSASTIKAETLIMHGDKDDNTPIDNGVEWKMLMGSNAKLKTLKNCGHCPMLDALEELSEAILSFLFPLPKPSA